MEENTNNASGLYVDALEEMERRLLRRAREVDGLDEEIALLRVKLVSAISQHPENTELLLKGVTVLIRAMSARERFYARMEAEMEKLFNVGKGLRDTLLGPELRSEEREARSEESF